MKRPVGVVSCSGLLLLLLFACLGSCELNGESTEGLPGHMQPLGSHRPMEGEIERISHIPDPVTFYQEYVEENRPVVLEGAIRDIPPLTKWTDEYIKDNFGEELVDTEKAKKEERTGPHEEMTLGEFIDRYHKENIYLVNALPAGMQEEMLMPSCIACGGYLNNVDTINMWFSSGGTKSVLHIDVVENMHCLVAGRKEFIMIPPQYAKLIGPELAYQSHFNLDVEQVNMTAYPGLVDVPWYKTVLQQGDCLYIPFKWVHHVHSTKRNIGVNLWWIQFLFNRDDCPSDISFFARLIPLIDVKPMDFVTIVHMFLGNTRVDNVVYAEDIYNISQRYKEDAGKFSMEVIEKIFDMAKPGCKGRIEESYFKHITHEQLSQINAYIFQIQNEFFGHGNVEEEENLGFDFPDFSMEDGLGDDDSSHIMVEQVYTSDSAGGNQGGADGGPLDETAGGSHPASNEHKPSEDGTRNEL